MIGRRMLCLSVLAPAAAHAADDPGLVRLMAALAAVRERRDTFTEEKTLPGLDLPLPSGGTLGWTAPDRLERRTAWPIEERISVAGGRISYELPGRGVRRDFTVEERPELGALLEAVRGTLAGDLPALRRYYEVSFAAEGEGWRLRLIPLSPRVRALVDRVVVAGQGTAIREVDTEGPGGVTRMRIAPG